MVKFFRTDGEERSHTYYAENACVIENVITFRILHVFEFRDGQICRENVWLDGASIAAQLTA